MPFYDYECKSCNVVVEIEKSMKDESKQFCPSCGKEMKQVPYAPPVHYKGPGWFYNERRKGIPHKEDIPSSPSTESSDE